MKRKVNFRFDPYSTIFLCFHKMFPKKHATIEWSENLHIEDDAWGKTDIFNNAPASVLMDTTQTVMGSVDTLIHELAHVGRGYPSKKSAHHKAYIRTGGHDSRWLRVYHELWKSYEKHYLTHLFLHRIGSPKGITKNELYELMSAVINRSFKNQLEKKHRRKKNGPVKASSR